MEMETYRKYPGFTQTKTATEAEQHIENLQIHGYSIMENVIYRIVQEGMANARNHSKSDKVLVALMQRGDRLRITIRDWGVGFNPASSHDNRFGIEGIRQRARLLGGTCDIKSRPGKGTRIVVELPVVEKEED